MKRKRILPPPFPGPELFLDEMKRFMYLLADRFIDYEYYDVYNSVFYSRVVTFIENMTYDKDSEHIKEAAYQIYNSKTTNARDYLKFFKMCTEYYTCE